MRKSPLLRLFTYSASFLSVVHAFSVTVGNPTQCDDLTVSWTGGQAPFEILLTPIAAPLHNYSVPASAFSNGKGSYSISQLPIASGKTFMLTMSDATGFASGGTTTVLTVGAPVANNNCNSGPGVPDFYFQTPLQLQQCAGYQFTGYQGAVLPATITALIPGGEHVSFYATGSTYTWTVVDVQAGTNLVFFMIDSNGKQGGVSPLDTVLPLSDSSCLNVNSPSSTMSAAPSQTSSQSTPSQTPSQTPSGNNTGIIAGATVGGVVFLALLIIVGIYCIRKKSRQSRRKDDDHEVKKNLAEPESRSHLSAGDPFNQHLRHISYTDSFAGSSSVSSASRLMGGQTASSNIFPHQTLPVGLAAPIHPGAYSHLTNAPVGNFAVDDPHSRFSQVSSSRLSSNLDSIAGYGQMTAMDGRTASQSYSFPSPTHHSYSTLPNQQEVLSHYRNSLAVNDPSSSLPTARSSSNMDGSGSASHVGAGRSSMASSGVQMNAAVGQAATSPSAHVIMHTDIEDVPTSSNTRDVIELPPQYADREPRASQPASAPDQKLSVLSPPDSIMYG